MELFAYRLGDGTPHRLLAQVFQVIEDVVEHAVPLCPQCLPVGGVEIFVRCTLHRAPAAGAYQRAILDTWDTVILLPFLNHTDPTIAIKKATSKN